MVDSAGLLCGCPPGVILRVHARLHISISSITHRFAQLLPVWLMITHGLQGSNKSTAGCGRTQTEGCPGAGAGLSPVAEWSAQWGRERVCWALLRRVRLQALLRPPQLADSLELLALAQLPASDRLVGGRKGDEEGYAKAGVIFAGGASWAGLGGGVGVGECMAWVEKTRGDLLLRDKQFAAAREAYREALKRNVGDVAVRALLHSDIGAAEAHVLPGVGQSVETHYKKAVALLPSLAAQLVLGTLGTRNYNPSTHTHCLFLCHTHTHTHTHTHARTGTQNYGEQARVVIAAELARLAAASSASAEGRAWMDGLETFLQRRREQVQSSREEVGGRGGRKGRGGNEECKETVFFFCRLRGQTPGSSDHQWGPSSLARGIGGSEEAVVYLSRELSRRGYCVRVYGNPPPEEWGWDTSGVEWLPFWAFSQVHARDDLFV